MSKYTITITNNESKEVKSHQVAGFNMQLIESKEAEGFTYKNHQADADGQEVASMIIDLMRKFPDLSIEVLKGLMQSNKRAGRRG